MANISNITLPDGITRNIRATGILYGKVDSTSTSKAFTATIPEVTEYYDGLTIMLKNGVVTSESGFTLNINDLGAKHSYTNLAAATADTTIFNINYTMLFIYDSTRVSGGGWICYRGYDANTNTIGYQLRTNSGTLPASDKGYRYRIWFTSADGTKWVPANTSTSTDATTARTLNSRAINPFGPIVYYSVNGTTNAGSNLTATGLWQQYAPTVGYSYVLSMHAAKPVYCKCRPNSDGSATMNVFTQTLPTTEDGFIYIFLGIAQSATVMELRTEHPVYEYKDGGLRLWSNTSVDIPVTSVNGKTGAVVLDASDVGALPSSTTIPSKTSQLTNDSGFITSSSVPTNVSAFTNDAGYITSADVPEGASAYTGTISAVGTSASSGTNNGFARGDHVHNITKTTIDTTLGTGTGTTKFYREDGTWQTPNYTTNTDTKLQVGAVTSGTTYYPIVGTGTTAATRQYDTTGLVYVGTNGTTSAVGSAKLTLGNSTASGTANNKQGQLILYGTNAKKATIALAAPSADVALALPTSGGTLALVSQIPDVPKITGSSIAGISIANHSSSSIYGVQSTTTSVIGVQSDTTTASKVTLGTAISVPNVTSAGSASTWAFEEVSIPNVTSAGSASTWTFEEKTIPNVTAAGSGSYTQGAFDGGSGSFSATVSNHVLSFSHTHIAATHGADSHTHTAPTIGTAIKVQSKSGGSNGTAPTLGIAIKVQSKKSGANGSAPTLGTAISIPNVTGVSDVIVPIKNSDATTVPIKNSNATNVVTNGTHSITDSGHTHSLVDLT